MESKLVKLTDNIDIDEVEKNTRRFKTWTNNQKKLRLEKLYESFNPKEIADIEAEVLEICYDKSFFENTGTDYSNPDILSIKLALADYLLRNQDKINKN